MAKQLTAQQLVRRRNAQEMLAKGMISREDYDTIGRLNGFVAKTTKDKALTVASVSGFVLLAAGAAVEIASTHNPALRGPLSGLLEVVHLIVQGLGG